MRVYFKILLAAFILLGLFSKVNAADSEEEKFEVILKNFSATICTNYSTLGRDFAKRSKKWTIHYMAKFPRKKGGSPNPTIPEMIEFLAAF